MENVSLPYIEKLQSTNQLKLPIELQSKHVAIHMPHACPFYSVQAPACGMAKLYK